jgi:hypothetical protein
MHMWDEAAVTHYITNTFPEAESTLAFGYTMFFFGSERMLPFTTLISADTEFDRYSRLDRPDVYRLNIGVGRNTFTDLFGMERPDPASYDYSALDVFMPHPEYAAQHFLCILSPSDETVPAVQRYLAEAYDLAARRNARRSDHGRRTADRGSSDTAS